MDAARRIQQSSPVDLRPVIGPIYYRYLSFNANRKYSSPPSTTETSTEISHVVILVIDGLRPDYTPDLPLEFTTALAPSTWTFPSVTSIHSGELPHEHGANVHVQKEGSLKIPDQIDSQSTIAHQLDQVGYDTYLGSAFINPFLATQGWYQQHRVYADANAKTVLDDYQSWRQKKQNTFSYLHFGDLHAPVTPPKEYVHQYDVDESLPNLEDWIIAEEYNEDLENWTKNRFKLYEAALEYLEDCLSPVINEIKDDTMIILTGDHGEAFFDHRNEDRQFSTGPHQPGVGHGGTPLDVVARVPFAVYHPNKTISEQPVSLIDVPKTICDGVGIDSDFNGVNLFTEGNNERVRICEGTRYGTERKAVYQQYDKIIDSHADSVTLGATVRQRGGDKFGSLSKERIEELCEYLPDQREDNASEVDNRIIEDQLRALGYK